MKKRLFVLAVAVVVVLSMSMALFVGCLKPLEFGEQTIGTEAPENVAYSFEEGMSAFEMLEVGMNNYYDADVAVVAYAGSVITKVAGVKVVQNVISNKIRVGKGDADGNNANDAKYFADNISYGFKTLYEKIMIGNYDVDAVVYMNSSESSFDKKTGVCKSVKWNTEKYYADVEDLVTATDNNPTILWMYDLQADFVKEAESTQPVLENGVYSFTLVFDPIKSTVEYKKTMQAQLEGNAGMTVKGLDFTELTLKVELWENGAIKRIFITESYKMNLAGIINSTITLNSDTQYAYEEVEGYKLQEHWDNWTEYNY